MTLRSKFEEWIVSTGGTPAGVHSNWYWRLFQAGAEAQAALNRSIPTLSPLPPIVERPVYAEDCFCPEGEIDPRCPIHKE